MPLPPNLQKLVEGFVLAALEEVQTLGGHTWERPSSTNKPIGELEGFDSLTGIEATAMVEQKLQEKFGPKTKLELDSIFVSKDGDKALTVSEIVAVVCGALHQEAA